MIRNDLRLALTPRQLEIVAYLAEGWTTKETAHVLGITRETVKRHVYRARERLGLRNRAQLIMLYAMWRLRA